MKELPWATPLPGLLLTLGAFELARALSRRAGDPLLLNPVALAIALLIAVLQLFGVSYAAYAESSRFLIWLLAPATVALGVPLARDLVQLRRILWPVLAAVFAGSVTSVVSVVLLGRLCGASDALLLALTPKSVTTPIAMGIASQVGAAPELTAALVVSTGIIGASLAPFILRRLRVHDAPTRGIATGAAAHGIGTASLYRSSPEASGYAGLAMGLTGLTTALVLPWLLRLLGVAFG